MTDDLEIMLSRPLDAVARGFLRSLRTCGGRMQLRAALDHQAAGTCARLGYAHIREDADGGADLAFLTGLGQAFLDRERTAPRGRKGGER